MTKSKKSIDCGSIYGENYPIYDALFNMDEDGVNLTSTVKRDLIRSTLSSLPIGDAPTVLDLMTGSGEYLQLIKSSKPHATLIGVDTEKVSAPIFERDAKLVVADAFDYVHKLANKVKNGRAQQVDLCIVACNAIVLYIWDDYQDDDGPYFDAEIAIKKIAKFMDDLKIVARNVVIEAQTGVALEDTEETFTLDLDESLPFLQGTDIDTKGVEFTISEDYLFHRNAFLWSIKGVTKNGYTLNFKPVWRSNPSPALLYSIFIKRFDVAHMYQWGMGDKSYERIKSVNELSPTTDVNLWMLKSYN